MRSLFYAPVRIISALTVLAISVQSVIAADYTVTPLQSIDGGANWLSAINSNGTITGHSFVLDSYKAATWDVNGNVHALDPNAIVESMANDINDKGQVLVFGPAIVENGVGTPIYTSAITIDGPAALNNGGQYTSTGYFLVNGVYQRHAFIVTSGTTTDLGALPGATTSWSNNMNNNGDVVGYSYSSGSQQRAVLWRSGTMIDLGVLAGQSTSVANDVNDYGRVVGTSGGRLFTWENGNITDLGVISTGATMMAYGMNNNGDIVGSFTASGNAAPHPFLWRYGQFTDLSTIVQSCDALDINDAGQIVVNCNNGGHGYILSPTTPSVDLAIAGSTDTSALVVNTPYTYTFNVTNVGSFASANVSFADVLPSSLSFQSVSTSQGSCKGGSTVTCSLDSLAGGAKATVKITVVPTVSGTIYNIANVTASETENNTTNNVATLFSAISAATADMSIGLTASSSTLKRYANLTYSINVKNNGQVSATGVVVKDTLPSGMQFVSASSSQGSCSSTTTVTCSLGAMANGSSAIVSIAAQARSNGTFTNTVSVSSSVTDSNSTNNAASATTTVK